MQYAKIDRPTERNYGIDLLRLVSMLMVVILHVLGQGGILAVAEGTEGAVAWLLEIIAFCAVDCYAIISGYVCYSDTVKPYHYKKFLNFWVQVFTYSFGMTLIAFLIKPEAIGIYGLISSMFPIALKQYWYASAYAGLFFVIPWINKLLQSCSKRECSLLVFVIVSVFVLYVTVANWFGDCFLLGRGYSFVWLVILYVVGAWMKKCNIPARFKTGTLFVGIAGCILFTWILKVFTGKYVFRSFC
ncbi:MAG: acyltransferase family protein [Clostridia bacterium]